jgi:quinol monooxygenase YgiN
MTITRSVPVWTHGIWIAKPGQEEAFVDAWTNLARASAGRFGAVPPTLLRDRERPNVFVTFGPFASLEAIDEFRSSDVFRDAVGVIRPLLESFEPRTLDEVPWA